MPILSLGVFTRATLAGLTAATLLAFSRPVTAQTLPALQTGTYLRLTTTQGFSVDGLLVSQTPDSVTINHIEVFHLGPVQAIAKHELYSIERRMVTPDDRAGSAVIWGAIDAGIVYASVPSNSTNRTALVVGGAACGVVIGLLFPMLHSWIAVPKQ